MVFSDFGFRHLYQFIIGGVLCQPLHYCSFRSPQHSWGIKIIIHLISPADLADEDFEKFHTELSQALKFIKYSKDKTRLAEVMEADAAYRSLSRRTADMVSIVTNSDLRYAEGKENVDMCEAIEGIRNDGIMIGTLRTLISLVKDGILSVSDAAARAHMTAEEFEKKMESYDA